MGETMKKFLTIAFIVLLVDRITKILVQSFLTSKIYFIKNFFYMVFAKNTGAAFSILDGTQFLLAFIAIAASVLIYYYVKKNNINNIGYALLFGGIIGNLIDRVVYNYVIDFIGLDFFNYSFPIFNIADACIVVGAAFVILGSDKNEIKSRE